MKTLGKTVELTTLLLLTAACGDPDGRAASAGSTSQGSDASDTSDATAPTEGGSAASEPATTGGASDSEGQASDSASATDSTDGASATDSGATTGAEFCELLCGPANTCCHAGETCLADTCVPECASGVLCAGVCCDEAEVCVADACTQTTGDCKDSLDCQAGEFCEPTLEKCLPQFPADGLCEFASSVDFAPQLKWSWTQTAVHPAYDQAMSAPLVLDLDDDGATEVIFTTRSQPYGPTSGFVRVLDGKTGAEKWDGATDALSGAHQVETTFSPAVADLDGDGPAEIVTVAITGEVIAFTADGAVKWRSRKQDNTPYAGFAGLYASALSIADMNGDGKGEVVLGGVVLDHTGKVVSGIGREKLTQLKNYTVSSIIADVDGDGAQDVVGGNAAYTRDGAVIWSQPLPDGFPAIADFDGDGAPELVVVTEAGLRMQDAKTGAQLAFIPLNSDGYNGPPTIADVDDDPALEIGIQRNVPCDYQVFDYDPVAKSFSNKWTTPLHACSGLLAATAFDFNGDKQVELVVHDDCDVLVLSGADGSVILKLLAAHSSWSEFTSIADVDGDKSADLLFSANNDWHKAHPAYCGNAGNNGVFVYSDPEGRWMPTRPVWNQQSYHVTNIKTDGSLPQPEPDSWGPDGFNNYRVSFQGKGVSNAADLIVDLEISGLACPEAIELRARVKNIGSLGVPAGVKVHFFEGVDATGTPLGEVATSKALLPGAFEVVTQSFPLMDLASVPFYVTVDGIDAQSGVIPECREDNNDALNVNGMCVIPA